MKSSIKIFADFNNADKERRIRLNTAGTMNDLKIKDIKLIPGLEVLLDDDGGLITSGAVQFSEQENIWVAKIDWSELM